MDYIFPSIAHLDQIRAIIKDKNEFIIAERDFGYVVNYTHVSNDTFPNLTGPNDYVNAMLRECRGLLFDKEGNIISRPFHKFFNLNEREETNLDAVIRSMGIPHTLYEKLDGSMIRPIWYPNKTFRLGTKMGITDTAMNAEIWLTKNPNYSKFITDLRPIGVTPIFEWISRKNKIVLDYPEEQLVLLDIRMNSTGGYLTWDYISTIANNYNIALVKSYNGKPASIQALIESIKTQEQIEGYVLRFDDGHRVKIKADWYVALHKTKDAIRTEKNVLELYFNNQIDDLYPLLDDNDRQKVKMYIKSVDKAIDGIITKYKITLFGKFSLDRKTFALTVAPTLPIPSIAFDLYGKKYDNEIEAIMAWGVKNCTNNNNLKKIKKLFADCGYPNVSYEEVEE